MKLITHIITRPCVAWVVLQTPPSLIKSVTDAFPPNLQNIITPKPFTQCSSSSVCHTSHVTYSKYNLLDLVSGWTVINGVYPVYPYA